MCLHDIRFPVDATISSIDLKQISIWKPGISGLIRIPPGVRRADPYVGDTEQFAARVGPHARTFRNSSHMSPARLRTI